MSLTRRANPQVSGLSIVALLEGRWELTAALFKEAVTGGIRRRLRGSSGGDELHPAELVWEHQDLVWMGPLLDPSIQSATARSGSGAILKAGNSPQPVSHHLVVNAVVKPSVSRKNFGNG